MHESPHFHHHGSGSFLLVEALPQSPQDTILYPANAAKMQRLRDSSNRLWTLNVLLFRILSPWYAYPPPESCPHLPWQFAEQEIIPAQASVNRSMVRTIGAVSNLNIHFIGRTSFSLSLYGQSKHNARIRQEITAWTSMYRHLANISLDFWASEVERPATFCIFV